VAPPEEAQSRTGAAWRTFAMGVAVVVLVIATLVGLSSTGTLALTLEGAAQATGVVIVSLAVLYFLAALLFFGLDGDEKKRVVLIFLLFLGSAMFWSGFEQAGSSMNLFAERLTDRVVFGWEAPASWLQSVNPLFIIVLSPVAGALWLRLGDRSPSIPAKFGIGLALLGIGFLVLAWASVYASDANRVTPVCALTRLRSRFQRRPTVADLEARMRWRSGLPRLSEFYGIAIYIYDRDHASADPPRLLSKLPARQIPVHEVQDRDDDQDQDETEKAGIGAHDPGGR
jgi:hypothetical protein